MTNAGHSASSAAAVRRRLYAFGVDYLAIAAYIAALWAVSAALGSTGHATANIFADPVRGQVIGFGLLTLPVILYFALWEGSAHQATPGKRALGLRVVSSTGARLSWWRSLFRSALKFLPWELAHTSLWRIPGWPTHVETIPAGPTVGLVAVWGLVALYLMMALSSPARRTAYDRAAGCMVVQE